MTPKEKAEELVNNFLESSFDLRDGYNAREIYLYAKQCALIAVDEIISCLKDDDFYIQGETNINEIIDFWQQVKQEIEKL